MKTSSVFPRLVFGFTIGFFVAPVHAQPPRDASLDPREALLAALGTATLDCLGTVGPTLYETSTGILARTFRARGRTAWVELLRRAKVPCGEVRDVGDALADPQLAARGLIATLPHPAGGTVRMVDSPIRLSHARRRAHTPPPGLGEHTEAILTHDLGLSGDQVRSLREQRVV